MNITVQQGPILHEALPLIIIGHCEGEPLHAAIVPLLEPDDFQGKPNQMFLIYPRELLPSPRLLLVGMGKRDTLNAETIRTTAAKALQKAQELKRTDVAISLPIPSALPVDAFTQALVEGAGLALYQYLEYKTTRDQEETCQIAHLRIFVEDETPMVAAQAGVRVGQTLVNSVTLARDLSNTPGNVLTPSRLSEIAQEVGVRCDVRVTVLGAEELREQGFGGILAVGQGSVNPPFFIIMEYGQAQSGIPTICLVGKGITFDTGGISIKPADKMDEMKRDMSGAAAVIATMQAVSELQLPIHLVGLVSTAENMPGGSAYKPGDVITSLSGKTIEVLNTDAEGRIVLADALFYAQRYQPQAIVDIATLTGAINIALGPLASGLLGNNDPLIERLKRAGETTHERLWQLPLWKEYHDMIKSDIADIKNIGNRAAGSITAAAFLAAFVGDSPWAHLDIAATAWTDTPSAYQPKGSTGVGVRLFVQMLRDWNHS